MKWQTYCDKGQFLLLSISFSVSIQIIISIFCWFLPIWPIFQSFILLFFNYLRRYRLAFFYNCHITSMFANIYPWIHLYMHGSLIFLIRFVVILALSFLFTIKSFQLFIEVTLTFFSIHRYHLSSVSWMTQL